MRDVAGSGTVVPLPSDYVVEPAVGASVLGAGVADFVNAPTAETSWRSGVV